MSIEHLMGNECNDDEQDNEGDTITIRLKEQAVIEVSFKIHNDAPVDIGNVEDWSIWLGDVIRDRVEEIILKNTLH